MLNTIKLGIFSGNVQVVSSKHFILLYVRNVGSDVMSYLNMTTAKTQQTLKLGDMQRWSRGNNARGQGQGHKKYPRPRPRTQKISEAKAKDSLSEDRHSRGQGQECSRPRPRTKDTSASALQNKKVFTKIFQAISKKKGLH